MNSSTRQDRRDLNASRQRSLIILMCGACLALAIFLALLIVVLSKQVIVAALVFVTVGLIGAAVGHWLSRFGSRFVLTPGIDPLDETAQARVQNLVDGLCVAHGVARPSLFIVDEPALNACTVTGASGAIRARRPGLVVTSGLIDGLSRVELEGVLAHELSHIADGDTAVFTLFAAMVSMPLIGSRWSRALQNRGSDDVETIADLYAVQMTRYPPGLAGAIEKMVEASTTVSVATPATAHLWFASPLFDAASEPLATHPALDLRLAGLREL